MNKKFDEISSEEKNYANAWMELGDVTELDIEQKMLGGDWEDSSKIAELIVNTCLEPEYLHFFTKYILNVDILPFQAVALQMMWHKRFPIFIASRGASKSFTLALYIVCRAVLHQGCNISVTGASLRQSMVLYNYVEQIWNNAPILRDICGGKNGAPKKDLHMCSWKCGNSKVLFLPTGDGSKIRGQRANIVINDEFDTANLAIFETVIRGFAAVRSDGVFGSVVQAYREDRNKKRGGAPLTIEQKNQLKLRNILSGNQIILAGTAGYHFGPLYKYYNIYKAIITSGGDKEFLKRNYPDIPLALDDINSADYAILRIPFNMIPKGMMDDTILNQGRATMDPAIFDQEYNCVFRADSEGFFLASYLKNATCPLEINGSKVNFTIKRNGDNDKRYIMGVDPASEDDNFAIAILEQDGEQRKFVYQWTTNRKVFEKLRRDKLIDDSIRDYHTFCIKHIRDLMRRFNVSMIVMDTGGGGVHIKEGLKDPDKMPAGDQAILDMDDILTANEKGHRILKMIAFSSAEWRNESHYGLRKDILDKILLFPSGDGADIAEAAAKEGAGYDTTEDTYFEILECINETIRIKHTRTPNGTERWDVPNIIGVDEEDNKKKLKKDRFTSLLLANWGCRLQNVHVYTPDSSVYTSVKRGVMNADSTKRGGGGFRSTQKGNRKIFF